MMYFLIAALGVGFGFLLGYVAAGTFILNTLKECVGLRVVESDEEKEEK